MNGWSAEWVSAIAGGVAAFLSVIAVGVSLFLAGVAGRQAKQIAGAQAQREEQARKVERNKYILDRGKVALSAAHTIYSMLSPRLSELLSDHGRDETQSATLKKEVRPLLASLGVEVALLRAIVDIDGASNSVPADGLAALLNEAAWLETDANHLAFLAFDTSEEDREVNLENNQSVVDALLNGSFVNLNPRLLAECADFKPNAVPSWSEQDSPWPKIYERRERILLDSSTLKGSWKSESLADAAARSLALSSDRFEDALVHILGKGDRSGDSVGHL